MTNIAIYCRVSKTGGSQNVERQVIQLREFAKHKNWIVVEEALENISGRKVKRKRTQRLIDLAKSNRIQKILKSSNRKMAKYLGVSVDTMKRIRKESRKVV